MHVLKCLYGHKVHAFPWFCVYAYCALNTCKLSCGNISWALLLHGEQRAHTTTCTAARAAAILFISGWSCLKIHNVSSAKKTHSYFLTSAKEQTLNYVLWQCNLKCRRSNPLCQISSSAPPGHKTLTLYKVDI